MAPRSPTAVLAPRTVESRVSHCCRLETTAFLSNGVGSIGRIARSLALIGPGSLFFFFFTGRGAPVHPCIHPLARDASSTLPVALSADHPRFTAAEDRPDRPGRPGRLAANGNPEALIATGWAGQGMGESDAALHSMRSYLSNHTHLSPQSSAAGRGGLQTGARSPATERRMEAP
ncbi:hypothetical protein DFJ73DRAFT_774982 [Zopfochytrium polystomum]|nr:hypothetical protein DFJ73DRAFT_774982 [Zopfochytrium polystomum]